MLAWSQGPQRRGGGSILSGFVETALVRYVRAINFRTARDVSLEFEPIAAFIGEPGAGKSNMLGGIVAGLDPEGGFEPADFV